MDAGIEGPAIVTQPDITTVVYPGHRATVDDADNLVVARGGGSIVKRFDPITLEVIRNRLDSIAAEIQATLLRSAYSVILKEGEDCSAALFNARGDVLAQSVALPQHMAAFIPAMARLLEAFPASACREGDVYTMNDPHDGGTHLPDLVVAAPVFAAGRTVGFSVCLAHQEDFGGKVPGSMPTDSTEIFQEGLILPPLKLYDAGVVNETLVQIIRRNVRLPRVVMGDISAQVAAATVGRDRLKALFEEYGAATDDYLNGLLDYAERLTRARIAEIPDGTWRFTDYMDNDGIALDRRVPITATVRVEGETVTVDFTGTSPQVAGPINAPWSGGAGSAYFAVRCVTDPSIPNNQGCYRPIDVVIPQGTLLNPHHPAPVAIRAHTLKRAADAACSVYGVVLDLAVQAVDEEATKGLRARLRGENEDKGAVWDRGFDNVEEAATDRRVPRPARGESRALSGRER